MELLIALALVALPFLLVWLLVRANRLADRIENKHRFSARDTRELRDSQERVLREIAALDAADAGIHKHPRRPPSTKR